MLNPRISIVLSGRNDDYGGNFAHRLNTCLRVLAFHARRHPGIFEIIVVEYNPVANEPSLASIISTRFSPATPARIITVPPAFHEQVRGTSKIPFLEYTAKNIGIRRSLGEFIVSTNPDIIFSGSMMSFLATSPLDAQQFYRANRHDVPSKSFRDEPDVEEIDRRSPLVTTRVMTMRGARLTSMSRWFRNIIARPRINRLLQCPAFNWLRDAIWNISSHDKIHVGAAGDFVMAHRKAWDAVGGFDQTPSNSFVDGYNLHSFACSGMQQHIIPLPIFHINHMTSNNIRPPSDLDRYRRETEYMRRTGAPPRHPSRDWGFPDEAFKEALI